MSVISPAQCMQLPVIQTRQADPPGQQRAETYLLLALNARKNLENLEFVFAILAFDLEKETSYLDDHHR